MFLLAARNTGPPLLPHRPWARLNLLGRYSGFGNSIEDFRLSTIHCFLELRRLLDPIFSICLFHCSSRGRPQPLTGRPQSSAPSAQQLELPQSVCSLPRFRFLVCCLFTSSTRPKETRQCHRPRRHCPCRSCGRLVKPPLRLGRLQRARFSRRQPAEGSHLGHHVVHDPCPAPNVLPRSTLLSLPVGLVTEGESMYRTDQNRSDGV